MIWTWRERAKPPRISALCNEDHPQHAEAVADRERMFNEQYPPMTDANWETLGRKAGEPR